MLSLPEPTLIKVGGAWVAASTAAFAATPTGSEIASSGIWEILAERYPFIFLALISVAGLLLFVRQMSQDASARETARDLQLFNQFRELREGDRAALHAVQARFLEDLKEVSARCHGSQDRASAAIENLLTMSVQSETERREMREMFKDIRDYLRDVRRRD